MDEIGIQILMLLKNKSHGLRYAEILGLLQSKKISVNYNNLHRIIHNLFEHGYVLKKKINAVPPSLIVTISDKGVDYLNTRFPQMLPTIENQSESEPVGEDDISNLQFEIDEFLKNEFADVDLPSEAQEVIGKLAQKLIKIFKKYL